MMNREQEIKLYQDFQDIVINIAKALGADWYVSARYRDSSPICDNRVSIKHHVDGREIFFRLDGGKIEISGIYNYGDSRFGISFPRDIENPSIKVSMSRGAEAIVREMDRRFFPPYQYAVAKIEEMVKNYSDSYNKKDKMLEGMAGLLGSHLTEYSRRNYTITSSGESKPRIEAKVSSFGIDLTLDSISLELAEKIIALVRNSQ